MFLKIAQRGKNGLGLYIATIFIVFIGYFVGQLPLTGVLFAKMAETGMGPNEFQENLEKMDFEAFGLSQNYAMVLLLLTFICGFLALWFCVKSLHKKRFLDIITPKSSIDWSKILFSFGLWFGLTIVFELIFYFMNPGNYELQFQPQAFAILAIIAIFLLPIQTSFEELFFRGYLLQGMSLGAKSRLVPLLITSIAFGLMHIMNPEIEKFGMGIMMTYYIGVGLFLGILTLMDDSLELALGVHAATNIYGATMVTFSGSAIQTPALFKMAEVDVRLMLVAFIIAAILFFVIVSKKYGLTDWSKAFGNVKRDDWVEDEELA